MLRWGSKARAALLGLLLCALFLACSGDDNGGSGNPLGDGGIPNADGSTESAAPCDCSSVACQGAPPLDPTVVASFYQANRFIYEGVTTGQCAGNPLQKGVATGTIDAKRDAVMHGKVLDTNAQPIEGVTLTVVGHPEFGSTSSGPDGTFFLAVNGGGQLAVRYVKDGDITVQRHALTPWLQYSNLPDVVMSPASAKTNAVTLGATSSVVDGDEVTDTDGKRTAHVYFAPGTTANAIAANGTKTALSSFHLRMTELTTGATGQQAMPADLPPASGYTYCTSFGVDEAPDAARVELSPPAVAYVDNFLSFHAGTGIPAGAFVPYADDWEGTNNGVAIKVLTAGASTTLDADGDGVADSASQLATLGITADELSAIGSKFAAGASFWRVPLPHFSHWDFNLGFGPPGDASSYGKVGNDNKNDCSSTAGGSILHCESQGLGEVEPLAGTGLSLLYSSERTRGFAPSRTLDIQLTNATPPPDVDHITLTVEGPGKPFSQTFTTLTPNMKTAWVWDGNDMFGRPWQGTHPVKITVAYWYNAVYLKTAQFGYNGNGATVVTDSGKGATRAQIAVETITYANVTAWDERGLGENGWSLAQRVLLDPNNNILYFGDGQRQSVETLGTTNVLVAGLGPSGGTAGIGDGGPATQATFNGPHGIAVAPDGTAYVSDEGNHKIRKIDPAGIITTFAGTGAPGFSGDGGPALSAQLQNPMGLALGGDGSLYIADEGNIRVRKVAPNGTITTIAGNGTAGFSGDGGAATSAMFREPHSLAIAPDQSLYVSDSGTGTVRRILPNGIITTVVGTGTSGVLGEGGPATSAQIGSPTGIAIAPTGTLYIADRTNFCIWIVEATDGILKRIAGTPGSYGYTGDGGPATLALLNNPHTVDVGPDANVYITDEINGVVRQINTEGVISTVAGAGTTRTFGGPPLDAEYGLPRVIKVMPDGSIWLAEYTFNQIVRFAVPRPLTVGSSYVVPTPDGRSAYFFDFSGRHQKTVDTTTGVTLLSFAYDSWGRITSVADRDGNTTTLSRDGAGCLTGVTSPWGHLTTLTCDANGYLANIKDPAAATTTYTTSADGLLQNRVAPNGDANTFSFDGTGRIIADAEPWGGAKTLTRTDHDTGWSVAIATAQGRTTTHDIAFDPVTGETRTLHLPDGNTTTANRAPDQSTHVTLENGGVMQTTATGDPRFDMMAPPRTGSYSTPLGNAVNISQSRAVTLGSSKDPTAPATFSETATLGGHGWTRAYDATSRTWLFTSPTGRTEQVALDAKGHVVEVDAPNRAPVRTAYDPQGRVTGITQDTRTWGLTYDGRSNVQTSTDPLTHTWHYAYDAIGRTTGTTRPDGQSAAVTYDVNGNVSSITPPGKTAHDFTYTPGDVPQAYKPPTASGTAANNTLYAFSQDLDLSTLTRADSQIVSFGYDTAGRLSSTTSSVGIIGLSYGATTGELAGVSDPNGESTAIATDGDLLTGITWSGPVAGAVGFQYDTVLRVSQETAGGNAVSYGYDDDNLVTSAGSETLSRFSADGYLSGTSIGAASDAFTYSEYGELATHVASISGTAVFTQNFTRDAVGRVSSLQETIDGATHTYGYSYDLADRLATVTVDGAASSSYTYDANGNATAATVRGVAATGSYDAQDRVTSYGGATFDWTAQGELLGKHLGGSTTSYVTDSLGRLQSVTLPTGHVVTYVYDGSNRRVGKKVDGVLQQGFLYRDAIKPAVELDGSGAVVSRFVYGSSSLVPDYIVKGGNTYRIFTDQVGSPRVVVDVSSGTVVERIDYDERGNTLNDTNAGFIPFGFAGGIIDRDTGLVRFGARDYDPSVGRWTEKDPIRFGGGLNLFGYCEEDAINCTDAIGLDPSWLDRVTGWFRGLFEGGSSAAAPAGNSFGPYQGGAPSPGDYCQADGGGGGQSGASCAAAGGPPGWRIPGTKSPQPPHPAVAKCAGFTRVKERYNCCAAECGYLDPEKVPNGICPTPNPPGADECYEECLGDL